METESFLFGFSVNPTASLQKLCKTTSVSLSPSSFSICTAHKPFSCYPRYTLKPVSPQSWSVRRLASKNHEGETDNLSDIITKPKSQSQPKRLAVFVSGRGSNFRAIHSAIVGGLIQGNIVVLVTDKPACGGAEYAKENGIPILLFPKVSFSSEGLSQENLVSNLREFGVEFILLAGFLKLLPRELVREYERSIINIHPSLLPAFGGKGNYGIKVHRAVIASGARYTGPTVHFVDEHYDTGRILAQRVVPVLANDSAEDLAARVLIVEHRLYTETVAALCEDRVIWREDGVPLIRSRENPDEYS